MNKYILFLLIVFAQIASAQKKKEFLVEGSELYNLNRWVIVTKTTFSHLKDNSSPGEVIEIDSSKFRTCGYGFRKFIDHAGNEYYWIHPFVTCKRESENFSENESEIANIFKEFAITFTIYYPYGKDTIFTKEKIYPEYRDTLSKLGISLEKDINGNLIRTAFVDNYGETGLDIIVNCKDKEILLRRESLHYGELCLMMRFLLEKNSPREAIMEFLFQLGRGRDISNGNKYNLNFLRMMFAEILPDAVRRLPVYKPFPLDHAVIPGVGEGSVGWTTEKTFTFDGKTLK